MSTGTRVTTRQPGNASSPPPGTGQWVKRFGGIGSQGATSGVVVAEGYVITGYDDGDNAILFKIDLYGNQGPGNSGIGNWEFGNSGNGNGNSGDSILNY